MNSGVMHLYSLALDENERTVLLDVLEEALKTTEVEEHRTEAFAAKQVVHAKLEAIESLLRKAAEHHLVVDFHGAYKATWVPKDGSAPYSVTGRYLIIAKRQPDGHWLISWEMHTIESKVPADQL